MKVLYGHNCPEKVVLTFGNFDGVHCGHVRVFSEVVKLAKERGCASAVLTFLPHTAIFLKNRENFLISTFEQKVEMIRNCGIDYLCVAKFDEEFSKLSPEAYVEDILIKGCGAKLIVVGRGCIFGYKCAGDFKLLESCATMHGCEVVEIDQLFKEDLLCSSSNVRECLRYGDIRNANMLLGRNHSVSGKVIRGVARGKAIGFPTLNLSLHGVVLPKRGVYYAKVKIDAREWFPGIVNIGVRPTFSDVDTPILEMHIFDFCEDIYDKEVTVELIDFVRAEKKFQDVESLVEQIKKDISIVKRAYKC